MKRSLLTLLAILLLSQWGCLTQMSPGASAVKGEGGSLDTSRTEEESSDQKVVEGPPAGPGSGTAGPVAPRIAQTGGGTMDPKTDDFSVILKDGRRVRVYLHRETGGPLFLSDESLTPLRLANPASWRPRFLGEYYGTLDDQGNEILSTAVNAYFRLVVVTKGPNGEEFLYCDTESFAEAGRGYNIEFPLLPVSGGELRIYYHRKTSLQYSNNQIIEVELPKPDGYQDQRYLPLEGVLMEQFRANWYTLIGRIDLSALSSPQEKAAIVHRPWGQP